MTSTYFGIVFVLLIFGISPIFAQETTDTIPTRYISVQTNDYTYDVGSTIIISEVRTNSL